MNIPDLPLAGVVVHALGWTLIHFLWQGLILAAVYQAVAIALRPGRASVRYWTGLACLLLALVVPILTFSIYYGAGLAPETGTAIGASSHVAIGAQPSVWLGLAAGIEPVLPWIVLLWTVGVALLSARTTMGWLGTQRLVRRNVTPLSDEWIARTRALAERLGVRRAVRILSSTRVVVPTLIGWLRPVILMPAGVLARMPAEQIEMIIAHELGHIRRNDYLFNFLQLVVETLLFYHPAIRWMSRRIREDRELCCDDLVVSNCGRPVLYAHALAGLESLRGELPATVLAASGGDLLARVHRIVRAELPKHSAGFAHLGAMLVLVFAAAAGTQPVDEMRDAMERTSPVEWVEQPGVAALTLSPVAVGQAAHGAMHDSVAAVEPDPEPAPVSLPAEREPLVAARAEVAREMPRDTTAASTASEPVVPVTLMAGAPVFQSADITPMKQNAADGVETRFDETPNVADRVHVIRPVETAAPRYPFRARTRGVEGFVKLSFSVDESGQVENVEVVDSYPEEIFDRAATRALKKWRFEGVQDMSQSLRLVQVFDFTLVESESRRMASRHCLRTGRRSCSAMQNNVDIVYVNPPTAGTALND